MFQLEICCFFFFDYKDEDLPHWVPPGKRLCSLGVLFAPDQKDERISWPYGCVRWGNLGWKVPVCVWFVGSGPWLGADEVRCSHVSQISHRWVWSELMWCDLVDLYGFIIRPEPCHNHTRLMTQTCSHLFTPFSSKQPILQLSSQLISSLLTCASVVISHAWRHCAIGKRKVKDHNWWGRSDHTLLQCWVLCMCCHMGLFSLYRQVSNEKHA